MFSPPPVRERERETRGKGREKENERKKGGGNSSSSPAYHAEAAASDSAMGVAASTAAASPVNATTEYLASESRRKKEGGCGQSSEPSERECLRRRSEACGAGTASLVVVAILLFVFSILFYLALSALIDLGAHRVSNSPRDLSVLAEEQRKERKEELRRTEEKKRTMVELCARMGFFGFFSSTPCNNLSHVSPRRLSLSLFPFSHLHLSLSRLALSLSLSFLKVIES